MSQRASRRSRTSKPAGKLACIQMLPLLGLPEFRAGDDLARAIFEDARKSRIAFENGDVLVIAQKIVSKVEGRIVDLSTIPASQAATSARKPSQPLRSNTHAQHLINALRS